MLEEQIWVCDRCGESVKKSESERFEEHTGKITITRRCKVCVEKLK